MIRHICMFKFKEENKKENIEKALELAEKLLRPIPQLARYEVVLNSEDAPESNYEMSLIFDYEDMEQLKAYQVHPNHIEFGNYIKSVRESRACIDYCL